MKFGSCVMVVAVGCFGSAIVSVVIVKKEAMGLLMIVSVCVV